MAAPPGSRGGGVEATRTAKAPGAASASIELRAESPEDRLGRARDAYGHNDFAATIRAVRGLLYPEVLLRSEDDVVAAHRLLGLAYLFSGEQFAAENEFSSLLVLRPEFSLDPVEDPRSAVAFLEQLKERERERLYEIELRRRAETERTAREQERRRHEDEERLRRTLAPVEKIVLVEKHSLLLNFVPFGAGQFQNGHRRKAITLLTTQLATGATSLALWSALSIKYNNGARKYAPEERTTALAMSASSLVFGAVFWAEVLYGIIDAIVYYKPQVTVKAPAPGTSAAPSTASLGFNPIFVPGGGGLGLQGVF